MKKKYLLLIIALITSFSIYSQEKSFGRKMALGFQLTQHQKDFGIGLNFSTPYFANEAIAFRFRGHLIWNQHLDSDIATTWSPYSNLSFGIVAVAGEIGNFMRLYGEGGTIVIFPSSNFSAESYHFGGYGLFGFEFFMNPYSNYFIELGGLGTGATADKLAGKPIYSNGFLINVGYRYQF